MSQILTLAGKNNNNTHKDAVKPFDCAVLNLLCPAPRVGAIKRRCASDVCLSVAYIGPKSRIEKPRKTKIGTEVAHVTLDSGHHF